MSNTKISALTAGGAAQTNDLLPIDRSGANFSLTAQSIASLATSSLTSLPLVATGLLAQYNMTDAGGANGHTLTDSSGNGNDGSIGTLHAPITQVGIAANIITVVCVNSFTNGQIVTLNGLTTTPGLNGTQITVSSPSGTQFTANLTHANVTLGAETGYCDLTSTQPTWIANTGGLLFNKTTGNQVASLPAALNGAKSIMLVTFYDPAGVNNLYGAPISPNAPGIGGSILYTNGSGNLNVSLTGSNPCSQAVAFDSGNNEVGTGPGNIHGYALTTWTIAPSGDLLYNYTVPGVNAALSTGVLGSGNYQLGGGHVTGGQSWFNGQILFAAFWNIVLTPAQVLQNVQAVQQMLTSRGLVLNGVPGLGTWQTPDSLDTFVFDGDSETGQLIGGSTWFPTITGSPQVIFSPQYGSTAEVINVNSPVAVDVNLPNNGSAITGGTPGTGANRAGIILFAGTNDSADGYPASETVGTIAKYCRDRRRMGWGKIYVTTKLSTNTQDAFKNSFNALMRQYWSSWADGLLDLGAVPALGADGAAACDNPNYIGDGTHWGAIGKMVGAWMYSYATRRMYGNTINGQPNTAVTSPYLIQPEDIFWYSNTAGAISAYLPPAQFFTGQTVTVKNVGAGTLTLNPKPVVSGTISATSYGAGILTVTVANNFTAGDVVVFSKLNVNTANNGAYGIVATASATQFTMAVVSSVSWGGGSDTAGIATLGNMSQVVNITALSLTGNVATITAANNYAAGQTVVLSGLTTTPGLNGTSAVVSGTGLSNSSFQIPVTHANIGAGAETGIGMVTYAAETIDTASTLTVASKATAVLLSRGSSTATGGANWIVLQNS
jgi:hypothetical protein